MGKGRLDLPEGSVWGRPGRGTTPRKEKTALLGPVMLIPTLMEHALGMSPPLGSIPCPPPPSQGNPRCVRAQTHTDERTPTSQAPFVFLPHPRLTASTAHITGRDNHLPLCLSSHESLGHREAGAVFPELGLCWALPLACSRGRERKEERESALVELSQFYFF